MSSYQLTVVSLVVLIAQCVSAKYFCSEVTFKNSLVTIIESDRTHRKTVTGCISDETLLLKNPKTISVQGQQIPILYKGAVSNIPHFFGLKIENNSIVTVKRWAFLNIGAHSISLNNNRIEWLNEGSFENLPSLETIDLEFNQIGVLPKGVFVNLHNLSMVSFGNNCLDAFDPNWFSDTPKLEYIFLHNNQLKSISKDAFSKFGNLKALTLENNWIEYVDRDAFRSVSKLGEVYLGNNRIRHLNLDWSDVQSLRFLGVDRNQLTYIPLSTLKPIEDSLENLWIHANPWQCSCFDQIGEWTNVHNVKLWWRCKNTNLFCYVPQKNSAVCQNRTDTELDSNFLQYSVHDCDKVVN